jgi:hypothetical protein
MRLRKCIPYRVSGQYRLPNIIFNKLGVPSFVQDSKPGGEIVVPHNPNLSILTAI